MLNYNTKKVNVYHKYYYRYDSYGDHLCDWNTVYSYTEIPQSKILQLHSNASDIEIYEDEYKLIKTVTIPDSVEKLEYFMNYVYSDYLFIVEKLKRNSFRKESSRIKHLEALSDIIAGKYSNKSISYCTGKMFIKY